MPKRLFITHSARSERRDVHEERTRRRDSHATLGHRQEDIALPKYHLAQVNIAQMKGPLDAAIMAGFVARLEEINALADRSQGFVWRLQSETGGSTYLKPYDD